MGFEPREGWKAKGAESNTVFEEIDLTDGEWVDYDEKVDQCEEQPLIGPSLYFT